MGERIIVSIFQKFMHIYLCVNFYLFRKKSGNINNKALPIVISHCGIMDDFNFFHFNLFIFLVFSILCNENDHVKRFVYETESVAHCSSMYPCLEKFMHVNIC